MKRMIALLLASLMLFGMTIPAGAAEDAVLNDIPVAEGDVLTDAPDVGIENAPAADTSDASTTDTPADDVTPAPEEVTTPAPEATESPAPQEDEPSPLPGLEIMPVPEATETPLPETTETPAPETSAEPTPVPEGEASDEPTDEPEGKDDVIMTLAVGLPVGQVDVYIAKAVEFGAYMPSFTVVLSNGEIQYNETRTAAADNNKVCFEDLPAGTYTLTVAGQYFVPYEQTIEVGAGSGAAIKLTAGRLPGEQAAGPHRGVLVFGDLNSDASVDTNDANIIMAAVDAGTGADLNFDNVTDLADAEYLAKGIALAGLSAEERTATVERFVPASAVGATAVNTTVTGTLHDLFSDNSAPVLFGTNDDAPISEEAPVEVSFDMGGGTAEMEAVVLEDTNISAGTLEIEYDGGVMTVALGGAAPAPAVDMVSTIAAASADTAVTADGRGSFTVNLNGKKAVKKVTLKITAISDTDDLASITQVEFVNDMASRIPEPQMDIPTDLTGIPGSREFTVKWNPSVNIAGYEVMVSDGAATEYFSLTGTSLTVTRFNKDEVRNYTQYTVQVQSVNGKWSSGYSAPITVTPVPGGRPDKPDMVTAEGGYESVKVGWKNMKDTQYYHLYYKEEGAAEFTMVPEDIKAASYTITGLNSVKPTTYEVYVVGVNELGESEPSLHASAVTTTPDPADMPQFKLINRDDAGKPGRAHILAAEQNGATMVNSPLDEAGGTAWGTVDGDPASYYDRRCWDDGAGNWMPGQNVGLTYTFDRTYTIDTIGLVSADKNMDYTYAKVRWFDSEGNDHLVTATSERRTDSLGRTYFFLRLPEPVETAKLQIGTARYWAGNNFVCITEVYFYHYDPLKKDIMDLYADDLHTTLRSDVTEDTLAQLRARIDQLDEFGHEHPDKAWLLSEWETAEKIFKDQFLGKVIRVHTGITARGDDHGFGGLNAWQPLGVTAAAGETVTIYVGHASKKTGSSTELQLVVTQYNAEANAMSKVYTNLKVGANEVKVPKIWKMTGVESGGALYIQYTGGASTADSYAVRVSGGTAVPTLDLYHVTDPGERANRTTAYVSELQAYVSKMEATHAEKHQGEGSVSTEVDYDYNDTTCILGATDIMLDTMMLSLPAQQILKGCGNSAGALLTSLDSMEDMMYLFYQHKGLNASAPNAVDQIPKRHLNIRYQRMFSGAFMYASGDHIGIGWNETAGMAGCGGVKTTDGGLWSSGNYFGWGIAHEIGHDINQGTYAIAEITNNYFAVLAQAKDTNDSVRFLYDNVYAKVTSGAKGSASNVFTQLGMYWQLHLAYDRGYNFKTYANYEEQLANLFWARVDTYARTPGRAPAPEGIGLVISGIDSEQALMRLCCAAAERNILDFFQRWGKTPDADTVKYASQFPVETRAIYYVCDDSRRYTIEHSGTGQLGTEGAVDAIEAVTAVTDRDQANKVCITITPNGVVSSDEILGYEIVRCTIGSGKVEKRPVGFTTTNQFEDVISAMNNRAVYYEITLVDKYLDRSAVEITGTVKIAHKGDLAKDSWTIKTTGLKADPITTDGTRDGNGLVLDPEIVTEDPATLAIDGKTATAYTATVEKAPAIEIDFHQTQTITGFRYTADGAGALGGYTLSVRQNGQWREVSKGTLNASADVYFSNDEGKYVSTYEADAVLLTLTAQAGQTVTVAELDVLGLTGDNVDFHSVSGDGTASIGYLTEDYKYGNGEKDVIPARSLVFTGTYKGNAAYNMVVLYDQDGNIVGGTHDGTLTAYQIILADVPEGGLIQDTRDGVWIYWLEPKDLASFQLPKKVRAELYRVNNAMTNEGQRLVSDTLFVDVPVAPGNVTIQSRDIQTDRAVG